MNLQAVSNLLGRLLVLVGLSMLLPLLCALHYQGPDVKAFVLSIIVTVGAGFLLCFWTKSGRSVTAKVSSLRLWVGPWRRPSARFPSSWRAVAQKSC